MDDQFSVSPVIILSLLSFIGFLLIKARRIYNKFKFYQSLPGVTNFSLIHGNLHKLPKTHEGRLQFGEGQMRLFNFKFHRFWFGPVVPVIQIYHPDPVKRLLLSSAPKSNGFGSVVQLLQDWIGEGLVVANGRTWARSRKLLTPAFHMDILKHYMAVYNEGADRLFKKLDKFAETGDSFDINPMISLFTLEGILKCAFSHNADIQDNSHPYATAVKELLEIIGERLRKPWMWPDWIFRLSKIGKVFTKHCEFVHRFAEETIERRRKTLETDGVPKGRYLDFIDILLTAKDVDGNSMTNLEIRNEVDTVMFAGHDTTASAIPWCLYTLAQNPEYQERVQEEIDAFLDGRESDEIKWADLSKLKTLAICLKESMRLYPSVPFIQRQINEDFDIDGHVIPKGNFVTIAIHHMHRNPVVWDYPEEYRPERFLVENKKSMDPFAFIPFSAGSRNCIGQSFALNEIKVLISRILRRYTVKLAPDHALPSRNAIIVLRSENGIWLTLQRRQR